MRCVYFFLNQLSGKIYVGQTKNALKRKAGHLYDARRGSMNHFHRALRKHGPNAFDFFVVVDNLTDEEADEFERGFIAAFRTMDPEFGYNGTDGGCQHKVLADHVKKRLSELNTGERNPNFGKPIAPKAKEKFAAYLHSEAHHELCARNVKLMADERRGKPGHVHTNESRAKIAAANSITQAGERNSQFGTVWIHNSELKQSRKVKITDLQTFLEQGWTRGRKIKW